MTPMLDAIYQTNFEMAFLLLQAGADPMVKNRWNINAIDYIEKNGNRGVRVLHVPKDVAAYNQFVATLKKRGLLDRDPPDYSH